MNNQDQNAADVHNFPNLNYSMRIKPLIFISHDSRDAELAKAFSTLLSDVSLGILECFISSDISSFQGIEYGREWFSEIICKLNQTSDCICLLTEKSINKPWILFEAGVAKGKSEDTRVFGVAIGIELRKVNTGPFGQFQNSADDEDSLIKLVIELVKSRIPLAKPKLPKVRKEVQIFIRRKNKFLTKDPQNSIEENNVVTMFTKKFEEQEKMIQDLINEIDKKIKPEIEGKSFKKEPVFKKAESVSDIEDEYKVRNLKFYGEMKSSLDSFKGKLSKDFNEIKDKKLKPIVSIEINSLPIIFLRRFELKFKKQEFENFLSSYENFITENQIKLNSKYSFSNNVLYAAGLAYHYTNNPTKSLEHLFKLDSISKDTVGKKDNYILKNKSIANYYIGLIYSNFNEQKTAIKYINNALSIDLIRGKSNDMLTRIVLAESYLFNNEYERSRKFCEEIIDIYSDICENGNQLPVHKSLFYRAINIRANSEIINNEMQNAESIFKKIENLLDSREKDVYSYYTYLTLAQLSTNNVNAKEYFGIALNLIESFYGLINQIVEVRSRVLLLMAFGLCQHQVNGNDKYLDLALDELKFLPTLEINNKEKECSVYSILSKLNVSTKEIIQDIENIKIGKVLKIKGLYYP